MKNHLLALLAVTAFIVMGAALAGCASASEDENTMPWSQPASWQHNKMPLISPDYRD